MRDGGPGGQAPDVRVKVLGPTEVDAAGRTVRLPGRRERALLAAVAARAPDAVPAVRLIDDVWHGEAPDGARQTLRAYVSTLRRALRGAGAEWLIESRPGGYALAAQALECLDSRAFEAMVAEAERLGTAGRRADQASVLRRALALWRGPAFADLAGVRGVQPKARRLEEARLLALERCVEAELACGRHAELAAELAELSAEAPLREGLWRARMIALYRSGRQSEALAVYRELFDRLRDELGIEPQPELRELQLAILRQDPALRRADEGRPPQGPPLPLALRESPQASFVGRTYELSALEACFTLARSGSGQVVLVRGEPGAGKTSLVTRWLSRAGTAGVAVLHGRCQSDGADPYRPLVDALRGYLAVLEPERRRELLAPRAASLGLVLPELGTPAEAVVSDPEGAREELFEAICELLVEAANGPPLVLVLDDLQWADQATLALLRHLGRRIKLAAILLVAICRQSTGLARDALQETLAALEADPGIVTIALSGLTVEEVTALVRDAGLPQSRPDAASLGRAVHAASAGSPLFVRHILAHLASKPDAYFTDQGRVRDELRLPAGVRSMIDRWLAQLPPARVRILCAAATIGHEFDEPLVAAVTGEGSAEVRAAIAAGERVGLILPAAGTSGRFAFTHAVVRQALYDSLPAVDRTVWHRRIGEELEEDAAIGVTPAATLATHFAAAARRGETEKAARYAVQAARDALRQFAFEDARAMAERALRSMALDPEPNLGQRCELNLVLSEACLFARDLAACKEAAKRAADDARTLGARDQLARAAELHSYLNVVGQPDPHTEELCRQALASLGRRHPARAARVLAGWADHLAFSRGDERRAETLSRRALAAARRARDDAALARALFVHGEVIGWTPRIEERLAVADELLAGAQRRGDARAECDARHQRALALLESGSLRDFDAERRVIERIIRRAAYWYHDMYLALWRGMRALLDGRLDAVESHAKELLDHARHEPNVVNLYLGQLYWLVREQGRQMELREAMLAALDANPGIPGFRCALALIHADLRESSDALAQLDWLAPRRFAALPRDPTYTMNLAVLAEVAAQARAVRHARSLYALLEPYRGRLIVATKGLACLGAADRYLAMLSATLEDSETAERHFDAAAALERRAGMAAQAERTELYQTQLRSARRHRAAASPRRHRARSP